MAVAVREGDSQSHVVAYPAPPPLALDEKAGSLLRVDEPFVPSSPSSRKLPLLARAPAGKFSAPSAAAAAAPAAGPWPSSLSSTASLVVARISGRLALAGAPPFPGCMIDISSSSGDSTGPGSSVRLGGEGVSDPLADGGGGWADRGGGGPGGVGWWRGRLLELAEDDEWYRTGCGWARKVVIACLACGSEVEGRQKGEGRIEFVVDGLAIFRLGRVWPFADSWRWPVLAFRPAYRRGHRPAGQRWATPHVRPDRS